MSDGAPLLELRDASFGYAGCPVLEGVDLAVSSGELIGVLGPNGGGKTTLFRGLLGQLEPLAGSRRARVTRFGFVPQRETLDPIYPLRVDEVVQMGAYGRLSGLRRLAPAERELARECLERVDLGQLGAQPFASLSGGQRQRVLFARALMARPEISLLDEPTSGVDNQAAATIERLVLELRDEGSSVLWVSHHLDAICRVATRILWVADGRVSELDPELAEEPAQLTRLYSRQPLAQGPGARP